MMTTTNTVCFANVRLGRVTPCECDRCEAAESRAVTCACCGWRLADVTGDEPLCSDCAESAS